MELISILFTLLACLKIFDCFNFYQTKPDENSLINGPSFIYLGCYNDRKANRDINEKDFSYVTKFNKTLPTVELCVGLCASHGFKIAAVQAFDECYCGNTYGRYKAALLNSSCFFQCAGKYSCGGYNSNSVYLITSIAKTNPSKPEVETKTTLPTSPCLSSPCLNSGVCLTIIDDKGINRGYKCKCSNPQDSGIYCEDRNFCLSNPCLNSGICVNNLNSYSCKCSGNWTGLNCNFPAVRKQINANCLDDDKRCQNGGSCLKYSNEYYYSCKCPSGFTGTSCEFKSFDICASMPCKNKGKCIQLSSMTYDCSCPSNYAGKHCELLNHCLDVSCGNGKCVTTNSSYYCSCNTNFAGEKCDTCASGFAGVKCNEIMRYCTPNPCLNGICIWDSIGFKCVCSEGWKGQNCSERNCLLNPCLNDGVCKADFDEKYKKIDYFCKCPKGYSGDVCELVVDPCLSSVCQTDEECVANTSLPSSFTCIKSLDYCKKMNICSENSECVYLKLNNSISCKCKKGADGCDTSKSLNVSLTLNETFVESAYSQTTSTPMIVIMMNTTKSFLSKLDEQFDRVLSQINLTSTDDKQVSFNSENLYWILPLGLILFVIIVFVTTVTYFGLKARTKSAQLIADSAKSSKNLQSIINDNMTFDVNISQSPNLEEATTSVSYLTPNKNSNSNSNSNNSENVNENGPV